jgi:hypothetical protein
MAPRNIHFFAVLCLMVTLGSLWIPTGQALAMTGPQADDLPSLQAFTSQIVTGQAGELVGVYIPEILAAHVTKQPDGNAAFVTPRQNFVTQFGIAAKFGSTGLLAHNYLAGQSFSKLGEAQTFYLIYGDGTTSAFAVTEILRYQALEPNSVSSTFKDLAAGETLTAADLFQKIYDRPGMVIFQTCIALNGNSAWGRLFIIAEPFSK